MDVAGTPPRRLTPGSLAVRTISTNQHVKTPSPRRRGNPTKKIDTREFGCPYDFNKPACKDAEPQAPRDLTTKANVLAAGKKVPKAPTLTPTQAAFLPLVNVHFHLGAEHKADDFSDSTDADAWDAENGTPQRRLASMSGNYRPGFMCNAQLTNDQKDNTKYTWKYCKDVEVGKSYEVHYVHSSAGSLTPQELEDAIKAGDDVADYMSDGLGGAANGRGLLNPMVVVQGQVYQITYEGASPDDAGDDLLHGWSVSNHDDAVMYAGSTTGPSHTNTVCSPYAITWHVDRKCKRVSAQAFDNMCKAMKEEYGLESDLHPHGSRLIVDQNYVVEAKYVEKYEEVQT